MKAKIGDIEIEGTPEEIKEFVNSHTGKPMETSNPSIATSNVGVLDRSEETDTNIHTQIKKEVDKDYV